MPKQVCRSRKEKLDFQPVVRCWGNIRSGHQSGCAAQKRDEFQKCRLTSKAVCNNNNSQHLYSSQYVSEPILSPLNIVTTLIITTTYMIDLIIFQILHTHKQRHIEVRCLAQNCTASRQAEQTASYGYSLIHYGTLATLVPTVVFRMFVQAEVGLRDSDCRVT